MDIVDLNIGGKVKEFPLGVSLLLYGPVGSGKTLFCISLTKEFLDNKLPCLWVCLDESPVTIREKLQYLNADYKYAEEHNLLRYIDAYTEQVTGKPLHDPAVINCSTVLNLNELNIALRKALTELKGRGLVVFDSLTTLLLYVNSSVCEEFLKVHVNRITSSKYAGVFIIQERIHDSRVEETFKMMMDGVLEFGFQEGHRKVGVDKLPLGTTSEWVSMTIPTLADERKELYEKPKPKKYLDSGGYLEDVYMAGGGGGEEPPEEDVQYVRQYRRPGYHGAPHRAARPGVQKIYAETIRLDGVNLTLDMQKSIEKLVDEQISLRNKLHGHEEEIIRDSNRLELIRRQINDVLREKSEIQNRKTSLENTIDLKRKDLSAIDGEIESLRRKYDEDSRRKEDLERKVFEIKSKKQILENKLKNVTGEEILIDIPELEYVCETARRRMEGDRSKIDSIVMQRKMFENELKRLEEEFTKTYKNIESKEEELVAMKGKASKIESEIDMIKKMRAETDAKLSDIAEKRRLAEEKLTQMMEETGNTRGG